MGCTRSWNAAFHRLRERNVLEHAQLPVGAEHALTSTKPRAGSGTLQKTRPADDRVEDPSRNGSASALACTTARSGFAAWARAEGGARGVEPITAAARS